MFHEFDRSYKFVKDLNQHYKNNDFNGYKRSNGTVGTRNYIGLISAVNCSAVVKKMADKINKYYKIRNSSILMVQFVLSTHQDVEWIPQEKEWKFLTEQLRV